MRVLLSSFAFAPGVGSEPGVGWNFAVTLARAGNDVVVLTVPHLRLKIESALKSDPGLQALQVEYLGWKAPEATWSNRLAFQLFYVYWQIAAYFAAVKLCRKSRFDLVHVVTTSGIRFPSFLGLLGLPLMIGPLGGGETAPPQLLETLSWRHRFIEYLRICSTRLLRYDPLMLMTFALAKVVLVRTEDTARAIEKAFSKKIKVCFGIGVEGASLVPAPRARNRNDEGQFGMLFVARLIYWKGGAITLRAFRKVVDSVPEARLTIVGRGPESAGLRALAQDLGIDRNIVWRQDWLSSKDLESLYESNQLMLFPSLHEAGGTVVLEALTKAMPVICLDIGGPGQIVTPRVGTAVLTQGRSAGAIIDNLADAAIALARDEDLYRRQSEGALAEAERRSWKGEVQQAYQIFSELTGTALTATGAPS